MADVVSRRLPDLVTVSVPVNGTWTPRRRMPRARPATRHPKATEAQVHPGILDAAWRLRREGEVMRAAGPNVIILAHPGSAAYVDTAST